MSEHTLGPWFAYCRDVTGDRPIGDSGVRFWDVEQHHDINSGYRGSVCSVHSAEHINGITIAERNANAKLIAAAPDMLEALKTLLSGAHDHQVGIEEAEAAIAKAEGRE